MSDKPWLVNIKGNSMIYMSNREYLDHLLETSRKTVSPGNNIGIRCLIWDLEYIKVEQPSFYNKFSYTIENEISNLKRITKLEPYPRNRSNTNEPSTSSFPDRYRPNR